MMVGATLAAMMVCALREAALMVAMRGTARTMWYMVRSLERVTVCFSTKIHFHGAEFFHTIVSGAV